MTGGTECVSAAAEKPTTNWPTWHCQEACSRNCAVTLCYPAVKMASSYAHPFWHNTGI